MMAACGLLIACGRPARGEIIAFNIGFGGVQSPDASFGAAAGQPGFWNLTGPGSTTIKDLSGNVTTIGISSSGLGVADNAGGTSDFDKLMDTAIFRHSTSTSAWSWSIGGLPAGEYRVFVYDNSAATIEPDDFTVEGVFVSSFNVAAGSFVEGNNYKVVNVAVTDGSLDIVQASDAPPEFQEGFGIAGLQIVSVPEPTALALFAAALPLVLWRVLRPSPAAMTVNDRRL
jgi:hypothetical protein